MTKEERAVLGERISSILEKADATQKELAQRWHVSQSTISNWKTGKVVPPGERLIDIAKLGGVSVDWLIGNDGAKLYSVGEIQAMFLQLSDLYDITVNSSPIGKPIFYDNADGHTRLRVDESRITINLEPNSKTNFHDFVSRAALEAFLIVLDSLTRAKSPRQRSLLKQTLEEQIYQTINGPQTLAEKEISAGTGIPLKYGTQFEIEEKRKK